MNGLTHSCMRERKLNTRQDRVVPEHQHQSASPSSSSLSMCSMPSTRAAGRGLIQKPASRRPNGCRNLPSSCVAFPEAQKRDPATFSIVFKTSHSRSSFWHWDRSHSRPTPAIVARLPELPRALSMRSGGKVTSSILIDAASWGVAAALPGPTKRLAAGPVGLMQAALDIAPLSVDEGEHLGRPIRRELPEKIA